MKHPNVVFVFADQWRAQATGYADDPNVRTPHLDALARESVNFTQAVSGCPVCAPYRASLMTGQYAVTHGVFLNDVELRTDAVKLAEAFAAAGYDTANIGKWHLDGHGRSAPIPPSRRLGFQHWKTLECSHDYHHSAYHDGDATNLSHWDGYDALAQTEAAADFFRHRRTDRPFLLVLSWGPPHPPYDTAPEKFRALYDPATLILRPNVPTEKAEEARQALAGYYAHCSALDECVGRLRQVLGEEGLTNDTVLVFTSDHGDMLGSQGEAQKQRPWDESVRVPFLLHAPGLPGFRPGPTDAAIDAPDIMPTLLSLCGLPIPPSVEGKDFSPAIRGEPVPDGDEALLMCPHPFGQWSAVRHGGREYRGLRSRHHTYVRALDGPWLLYDNEADPYQMTNRVQDPAWADLLCELDARLHRRLQEIEDPFAAGEYYLKKWNYTVGENGAVAYRE